ncbi:MAG: CDP-diacylglycerol--serine O-phosphatidyltransferase [Actinomycetia bacterium]|nr:CDP-diacylglycerol--serine O-phosphatidyltransferase [Actinomycetes bacterium]
MSRLEPEQPQERRLRRRLRRRVKHRRRRFDRWRLISPTGAEVVSLRQLSRRDQLRVTAPSIFTTGNMACGFASVLLAFRQHFGWAAGILFLAILLDIADGFVARKVGATSPFGVQLDSMADLISFGMAPAVLVHTWALDSWPIAAWAGAFFWLACAAFRLARFNVTVDPMADKRYFVGLPSPGAAAVIIATIFALDSPDVGPRVGQVALLPVIVAIVPALLMVTSVRFRSFRNLLQPTTGRARATTAAVLVAVVVGLVLAPALTMLVLAYAYVLSAPLGVITAPIRERLFGPDSVAPPRYRVRSVFIPDAGDPEVSTGDASDTPDASNRAGRRAGAAGEPHR